MFFRISVLFFLQLAASRAFAYPDFIGIGYKSCSACHVNGAGGGPLSDYGRSLFAVEIARRPFWNSSATSDELGDRSGFLGGVELPAWFKPYAKFRQLGYKTGIGTEQTVWRNITMQSSVGVTSTFGPGQKFTFSGEVGYVPTPLGADPQQPDQVKKVISREHYLRWKINANNLLYFGFLDKPFGLRIPDHSAVSRGTIGFGQNDQSHGVMWHRPQKDSDFFFFLFGGNQSQEAALRQKGASMMYEWDRGETLRWGFSLAGSSNDYVNQVRTSIHMKRGLGEGSALLIEGGFLQNAAKEYPTNKKNGVYGIGLGDIGLARGVYFTTQAEYYKADMVQGNPEIMKYAVGFLVFPMQRVELRTSLLQARTINPSSVAEDTLSWLGQLHFSF